MHCKCNAYKRDVICYSDGGTITSCTASDSTIKSEAKASAYYGLFGIHDGHGAPRAYSGGIVGYLSGGSVSALISKDCIIYSQITRNCNCTTNAECYTGGIAGYSTLTLNSSNCTVTGGSRTSEYYDNGSAECFRDINIYDGTYKGNE